MPKCDFKKLLCNFIEVALRYGFFRGRSRTAATSKIERIMIIVNVCKPLTIIT